MAELLLHTFLIDTVSSVEKDVEDDESASGWSRGAAVQMKTYAVVAPDPQEAFRRFTEEQAGEVVYTGDIVNAVIIGIQLKTGDLN